jgi:hypothetical protein
MIWITCGRFNPLTAMDLFTCFYDWYTRLKVSLTNSIKPPLTINHLHWSHIFLTVLWNKQCNFTLVQILFVIYIKGAFDFILQCEMLKISKSAWQIGLHLLFTSGGHRVKESCICRKNLDAWLTTRDQLNVRQVIIKAFENLKTMRLELTLIALRLLLFGNLSATSRLA